MKNTTKTIMLAIALGLPLAACSNASEHMDDSRTQNEPMRPVQSNMAMEKQNVETVLLSYVKQITAKDLSAMEPYVLTKGQEFTIFEGKGTNIGWADYRDNHLAPELANEDLVFTKYDYINLKTSVSGDLATATFSIDAAYSYKGKDADHIGRGTAILKKINGAWKIAHLHTS